MRHIACLAVLSTLGLGGCVVDASVARDDARDSGPPARNVSVGSESDGSTTGRSDAGSASDSGRTASGDSGTGGPSVGTPEPAGTKAGGINISTIPPTPANPQGSSYLFGFFQDATGHTSGCLGRDEGVCHVTTCTPTPAPSTAPRKSAGTLDAMGLTAQWDPTNNQYLYTTKPGLTWGANQNVTITAAGGDLSPFSVSVKFPEQLSVTSPAFVPATTTDLAVSKSAGIPLEWTTTNSLVTVKLSEAAAARAINITCKVPAPSTGFIVPPAALRDLSTVPTSSGGPTRGLQLSTDAVGAPIVVDGFTVHATANVYSLAGWTPVVSP